MVKTKNNIWAKVLLLISVIAMIALLIMPSFSGMKAHASVSVTFSLNGSDLVAAFSRTGEESVTGITVTVEGRGTITPEFTPTEVDFSSASSITIKNVDQKTWGAVTVSWNTGTGTSTDSARYIVNLANMSFYTGTVERIINIADQIVLILLILAGTAGSIYAVILGVNYAKAEDSSKREEAKKRLIGAVIGVVAGVALLVVAYIFTQNAATIIATIRGIK